MHSFFLRVEDIAPQRVHKCAIRELHLPFISNLMMSLRLRIILLAAFILHDGLTVVIGKVPSNALLCLLHGQKYLTNKDVHLTLQFNEHNEDFLNCIVTHYYISRLSMIKSTNCQSIPILLYFSPTMHSLCGLSNASS